MTSLNLARTTLNEILCISLNQDGSCFAAGTDSGFRIYHLEPFKETFTRKFSSGGIGIVEMLFRCNILALVGGGVNPRFPPHKVMIWDDHQNRCIGELAFRSDVKAVKLRRERVVVALASKVYVYNFSDLGLLDHIETCDNPKGLLALCSAPHNTVLATPGLSKGHVRIELYDQRKTTLIAAHEASLACIALNNTGSRVATASEKGTLIRVYDTSSGELLQELRRGADRAEIYSLAFNHASTMLACTSDKGTVHIFKLNEACWDFTPVASAGLPSGPAAAAAAKAAAFSSSSASASTPSGAAAASGSGSGGSSLPVSSPSASAAAAEGAGATGASSSSSSSSSDSSSASVATGTGNPSSPSGGGGGGGGGAGAGAAEGSGVSAFAAMGSNSSSGGGSTSTTTTSLAANPKSSFSFMKGLLPKYFSSEWSFAQFRVPETKSLVLFGHEPHTIIVIGADGSFFKASYEKGGGEAVRVAYSHFIQSASSFVD